MTDFLILLLAAIVGSFLNVCIYRIPRGESILFPGSRCPRCKKSLFWYDNIPFVSYLLLGGKCRFCREAISLRYVVVEGTTVLLFLILYRAFGMTWDFVMYAACMAMLIAASFIDLEHQIIPDRISLGGLGAGLLASILYPLLHDRASAWLSLWEGGVGAVVGGGAIYLIGLVGNFLFRKESMGGGDVKLLAMVGAFLGWRLVLVAFFIAPFFGSVVGLILKIRHGTEVIPYGPFLSLASFIALLWGREILNFLGFGFYL